MAPPLNKSIDVLACGCTMSSEGKSPIFDPYHPSENMTINRVDLKCRDHILEELKGEFGDHYYGFLAHMKLKLEKEKPLPPPPPIKHLRFSTEKPSVIGLGGDGAKIPSKYVGLVEIPGKRELTHDPSEDERRDERRDEHSMDLLRRVKVLYQEEMKDMVFEMPKEKKNAAEKGKKAVLNVVTSLERRKRARGGGTC
jgi:hypothetical protein